MDLWKRKHPRLKEYDYSQNGAYFVTMCTKGRECILSNVVGPDAHIGPITRLSQYGEIVDVIICNTNNVYNDITVEKYVIMPNHVPMLLRIDANKTSPMRASGPTIGMVIRAIKTLTTRRLGQSIWQDKFHDHIIRDEVGYLAHWQYIDSSPANWFEDEYCYE